MGENLEEINWETVKIKGSGDKKLDEKSTDLIFRVMERLFSSRDFKTAETYIQEALERNLYYENYLCFLLISNRYKERLPSHDRLYEKALEKGLASVKSEKEKKDIMTTLSGLDRIAHQIKQSEKQPTSSYIDLSKHSTSRNIERRI